MMISFTAAQVELGISSEKLIELIDAGEIAGRYRWPQGGQVSGSDVLAYSRDMAWKREQWTREWIEHKRRA